MCLHTMLWQSVVLWPCTKSLNRLHLRWCSLIGLLPRWVARPIALSIMLQVYSLCLLCLAWCKIALTWVISLLVVNGPATQLLVFRCSFRMWLPIVSPVATKTIGMFRGCRYLSSVQLLRLGSTTLKSVTLKPAALTRLVVAWLLLVSA